VIDVFVGGLDICPRFILAGFVRGDRPASRTAAKRNYPSRSRMEHGRARRGSRCFLCGMNYSVFARSEQRFA
jgi:hypothetical protein